MPGCVTRSQQNFQTTACSIQSFADTGGVKKLLTTVPVRKPNRQDFVRVHPDPEYRLTPAAIIELKDDREVYLLTLAMAFELTGEFAAGTL